MIKAVLPITKISRNNTEEKTRNFRLMVDCLFLETGIENKLLYAMILLHTTVTREEYFAKNESPVIRRIGELIACANSI
jgi:hypothetical protein